MNVLIRADSSSFIGTGHIMRDLVLAKQFPNDIVTFAVQDLVGNINFKITEEEYPIAILKSNEYSELNELIQTLKIDFLVIDHYEIDYEFEKKIKENNPKLKLMVLDDTYEKHFCDILLNHNVCADKKKYGNLVPEHCKLKCGKKHTLLRKEFQIAKAQKKKENSKFNIFLAMGGADHSNINIKILEVLSKFREIEVNVVTTSANQNLNELKEYLKKKTSFILHLNTKNIASLMHNADLAIITPSVTLNEIIYMETPFVAIKTAENQIYMHEYLLKKEKLTLKTFKKEIFYKVINNIIPPPPIDHLFI